jgi:predicted ATP-grasp superfamily ATP-dependent carboligase
MKFFVYEVIIYEGFEVERLTGELVISISGDLAGNPYGDDNPRVMGSNESLRIMNDGNPMTIHISDIDSEMLN